jgi:hypothetical protein
MWRNSLEHMFSHRHPDTVCAELLEDSASVQMVQMLLHLGGETIDDIEPQSFARELEFKWSG